MPAEKISKKTRWECQHCAKCCKDIIISQKKILSTTVNGKTVCKNLDLNTNSCKDYKNRPFICKIYPFIIDFNAMVKDSIAIPQNAFKLENLNIHTECPGYGKGKRVYANKNLQRKLDRLAYEFAVNLKKSFETDKDVSKVI